MAKERLQKIIARSGLASRRKAEGLIRDGRVTVSGRRASVGDRADPARDSIRIDGKPIPAPVRSAYLLLNKPAGYITSRSDDIGRPTVLDLVPRRLRNGLRPVGRLDYNTEGLLLLTTDGEFAHRVSHPRYGCLKTYEVKVKGRPSEDGLARLRAGMVIDGRRVTGANVRPLTVKGHRSAKKSSWWTVRLGEGRTRQVREMFFRIGNPVQRLRRVGIGPVTDPSLPKGAFRELTDQEIRSLRGREQGRKR
jgi:pseudouridine synthase